MKKIKIENINDTGFRVPENYLRDFEAHLLSEVKLKDTIPNNGFKVPDTYFDTLEERIISRVSKTERPKVIPLFSKKSILYASTIAAAILLLFNISFFEKEHITFDSLDLETAENYIIDENISSYEIASLLSEDDFLEDNFVQQNFNEEIIETYILNNLDIDDLIVE